LRNREGVRGRETAREWRVKEGEGGILLFLEGISQSIMKFLFV